MSAPKCNLTNPPPSGLQTPTHTQKKSHAQLFHYVINCNKEKKNLMNVNYISFFNI